jgi:hypothetical protein
MTYYVELVWNREFHFCRDTKRPFADIGNAVRHAEELQNSGDGARVKKTRVVDENGHVVWAYGQHQGYQPTTGQPCNCRPGRQRDNCSSCEGTGMQIDFKLLRSIPLQPS